MTSNRENISVAGPARLPVRIFTSWISRQRIIMIANLNFQAQPWVFFQYREPVPGYLPAEQWSFMAPRGAPREPPTDKPLFFFSCCDPGSHDALASTRHPRTTPVPLPLSDPDPAPLVGLARDGSQKKGGSELRNFMS